jgi:hypothetical protein
MEALSAGLADFGFLGIVILDPRQGARPSISTLSG